MMKRNFSILTFLLLAVLSGFNTMSAANSLSDGQGIDYYRSGFPAVAKPLLISSIASEPDKIAESCYYLGSLYFAENNADSASYYFTKGNTANPLNSLNAVGLSMIKMKSNLAEAELEITNLLKLKQNKKNIDILIAIGNAYLANGILDKAVTYQEKAKDIKSKYAPVYVLLGDIEVAKKNAGEACRNYEQAIYFDNKCKEAYIKYARAYKSVNSSLAIEKLNTLKTVEPGFMLADRELADTYFAINNYPKAAECYEAYLKTGNSSTLDLTKYAFILYLSKLYEKSLDVVALGLQKEPLNSVFNRLALYNNVELTDQYNLQKQSELAQKANLAALNSADVFFNKSIGADFKSDDYRNFGRALKEAKKVNESITQFEKAYSIDSSKVENLSDLADLYADQKNNLKSLNYLIKYTSSLPADKQTSDVLMKLGKSYYTLANDTAAVPSLVERNGYFNSADSLFAIVAQKEPTNYRGNFYRARVKSGLDVEAVKGLAKPFYEQTVELLLAKNDARYNSVINECYRYLAYYYYQSKDYTQCQTISNKLLALDPTSAVAKTFIDLLKKQKR